MPPESITTKRPIATIIVEDEERMMSNTVSKLKNAGLTTATTVL